MPHRPPPGVFIQTPVAEEEAAADPARIPGNVSAAPRPPHSSASRLARAGREGGRGTRAPRGRAGRAPRGGRGARGQERGWGVRVEKEGARAGGRAGRTRRCLGAGRPGPESGEGLVRDDGCGPLQLSAYPTKWFFGRLPMSRRSPSCKLPVRDNTFSQN